MPALPLSAVDTPRAREYARASARTHDRVRALIGDPVFTAMIVFDTMTSPVGELLLAAEDAGLTSVWFEERRHEPHRTDEWRRASEANGDAPRILAAARAQLEEYFAGTRPAFELPLAARGTPFQERVWAALRGIPFGATISYAELARRVGDPRAVRAVGLANGRNPLSIIVPCHRVIGADGSLTGYGGGLARKRWLLEHEGALRETGTLSLPL